jgi:hypothetical protein
MTARPDYTFVFDDYEVADAGRELHFLYHYEDAVSNVIGSFDEHYKLPLAIDAQDKTIAYILRQLHLLVGISYYKSLLGNVRTPYALSPSEADYFNTVYHEGLGEYSFVNKITDAIRPFTTDPKAETPQPENLPGNHGAILGVGGGKDSIVAAEITKGIGLDTVVLDVATQDHHGQAGPIMNKTGLSQLRVERYLDRRISSFAQEQDGNRGHVPISVFFAWIGTLLAAAAGKRYIMMANEAAASEGNVTWNGRLVNHQWAKSFEAEKLTQEFIHAHVSPDLWYFSPIRAYGSLAVMELFVALGQPYYQDFTSCNQVLRIDPAQRPNGRWCTHCAKCLSTWLLLSAKLPVSSLEQIFERNLFDDTSLRPTLDALLGLSGHKPLDCVGTTDELRAVTRLALGTGANHPLLDGLRPQDIPGPDIPTLLHERSSSNLPPELISQIGPFVDKYLLS